MAAANEHSPSLAKVKTKSKDHNGLLSYDELPPWYQDNDCIRHGYRPVMNHAKTCFESWTYLHNETANIYSHLLPALLAMVSQGLIYKAFPWYYPQATTRDYIIFAFHLCSASICFGLSALYHTLMNRSAHSSDLWGRIDYTGIVILILGDFVSGIYVGFYCEPILQNTYWTMVCGEPCVLLWWLCSLKMMLLMIDHLLDWYARRLDGIHCGPSLLPEPTIPPVPAFCLHSYRPLGIRSNYPRLEVVSARATQQAVRPSLLLCRGWNHSYRRPSLWHAIPGKGISGTIRYLGKLSPDIPRACCFGYVYSPAGCSECI